MPRYSATAAGANMGASPSRVQRMPSISPSSMPASSRGLARQLPVRLQPEHGRVPAALRRPLRRPADRRSPPVAHDLPPLASRQPTPRPGRSAPAQPLASAPAAGQAARQSMRIASLLPSATEIVFAVGAGDEVVGVSHECDYPAAARGLPVLTGPAVETRGLPQAEIDAAISSLLASGGSTYDIDVPRLRELQPDLVITQALCDVCAVSEGQVHRVVHEEQLGARVLTLTPLDLEGVARSVEEVGEATGRPSEGARLAAGLREGIGPALLPPLHTAPRARPGVVRPALHRWTLGARADRPCRRERRAWQPRPEVRARDLGRPWPHPPPTSPSSSPAASPSTRSCAKPGRSPNGRSGAASPLSRTAPSGPSTRTPGSAAPVPASSTASTLSAPSSPTPPATTPSPAPAASPPPDRGLRRIPLC